MPTQYATRTVGSIEVEDSAVSRATTMANPWALIAFCVSAVLVIPLKQWVPGTVLWGAAAILAYRSGDPLVRRNYTILLGATLILALSPISTDLTTPHFFALGIPFWVVTFGIYFFMNWRWPGSMIWRFWPQSWSWRDVIYVAISVPLSWGIIWLYFFHLSPDVPTHWPMPPVYSEDEVRRLVIGINLVGIWDELFFINIVYVLLRAMYPARIANLGQAVIYTAVLYTMAFTGFGPLIIYMFALTQGAMYERSGLLLYVLLVHLIVDFFLVLVILQYHYPGQATPIF